MMLDENEPTNAINTREKIQEIIPDIIIEDGVYVTPAKSSLSTPLRCLFWCNGATLSLPSMALMYIANTRANIPLAYLSAYGALAFLPFSLKPMYASLSRNFRRRDRLLTALLAISGIAIMATACVPKDGVGWCFFLGFVRGFTGAWPEFLLGLTLIDQAMAESTTSFDHAAALFQSQAATCRNLGSLSAHIITFLLFAQRHHNADVEEELSSTVVTVLLLVTGMLPIIGAGVAFFFQVGLSPESLQRETTTTTTTIHDGDGILMTSNHHDKNGAEASLCLPHNDSYSSIESLVTSAGLRCDRLRCKEKTSHLNDVFFVALFQLMIVVFAIRGPFTSLTSTLAWNVSISLLTMTLVFLAFFINWTASHRVGIYLALRHTVPSFGYLMSSYMYWLFQSSPVFLQIMSLIGTGCTTVSSWSYGKVFAKYSSGIQLLLVIAVTTVMAALVSLFNIVLLRMASSGVQDKRLVACSILVSIVTSFFGEWRFLPSVVLATTSSKAGQNYAPVSSAQTQESSLGEEESCGAQDVPRENDDIQESSRRTQPVVDTTDIKYGTLVSCIDFGDQIGSWLMVPLVGALDITRENDWAHLDKMVVLCSIASVLSLGFLTILPRTST